MYQVILKSKYYVKDIDCVRDYNGAATFIFNVELTSNACDAKFFAYKTEAESIAEKIGGNVIEYVKVEQ